MSDRASLTPGKLPLARLPEDTRIRCGYYTRGCPNPNQEALTGSREKARGLVRERLYLV